MRTGPTGKAGGLNLVAQAGLRCPTVTALFAAQPISTSRLDLLPLHVEHAEEMAAVLSDPALHTFTGVTTDTPQALRSSYERLAAGSPDPAASWLNWVIHLREESRLTGTVQATPEIARWMSIAAATASVASPNTTMNPSPVDFTTVPRCASTHVRCSRGRRGDGDGRFDDRFDLGDAWRRRFHRRAHGVGFDSGRLDAGGTLVEAKRAFRRVEFDFGLTLAPGR